MSSAASGWCCRHFLACSGAALPLPDAYEGCESHKVSACVIKHHDSLRSNNQKTVALSGFRAKMDLYLVPEMSRRACKTRSVVQTSSSPQSLKKGI